MKIFIDADGCPVVDITVRAAKKYGAECTIICDTAHSINREGAETIIVDKGADSADLRLVNLVGAGDIAVTQDYGLAAMCLSRRAIVLDQDGRLYTEGNISGLLEFRAVSAKIRRSGGRTKGKAKRTPQQDRDFEAAITRLLDGNR
ncbi:YaiI/YqxD family protein [Ruminococcus sp.]|uniref:YaiI/YqxD family protein n=1 Tax=Ruminococcus sp. TaxID=41978 RepID=UPI002C5DB026|nr:YaiI/YqxD family protein [Ruminococcus sp.]HNZ98477.1 YaiI/YqxD family protein [Ruminococcus sp.]HOH85708.1 YaiI/YqxD family protein [Ruminococcus sp.]